MPEYKYTASDPDGTIISETLIADNEEEIRLHMRKEKLSLINIQVLPDAQEHLWDKLFNKVSNSDKAQFLEYFASMLEAGLSVNDVLQSFYKDLDKPLLRRFIKDTQYGIRNGKSLSECFAAFPELFPKLYVGMIEVGEASGTLAQSLRHLATQLEKSNELKSKVRNAMIYPAIIVTALTVIIIIMIVFVFPQLEGFFKDAGLDLPPQTQFFIDVGKFSSNYWYIELIVIAVIVFGYTQLRKSKEFRAWQGNLFLRIPIFGPINRSTNVALFARTLGSLLASGVNILESMDVVKGSLSSEVYANITDTFKDDLAKGNSLSDSMKKFPQYFSPFEIRVISISERTGEVSDGLLNIAKFYENKLYSMLSGLSSALEPILLISMGGIVVIVALSVITPIYQLLSGVSEV